MRPAYDACRVYFSERLQPGILVYQMCASGGDRKATNMTSETQFADATSTRRTERPATILWHPDIHRQAAQEDLAFLTIGFEPRYHRPTALQIIDRANASVGIRSYVLWELQRKPDILMRAWIPAGKNTDDLWRALHVEAANNPQLRVELVSSTYVVQTVLHHHLWSTRINVADIDDVLERGGDILTSGALYGDLPKDLEPLLRRQLISCLDINASGIKFFIWLAPSELLPNERAQSTLESELIKVVTGTPRIYATSVYRTLGPAPYLVSGRFKPEHYEVLARELQPRLSILGEPFFATSTDTSLSTLFGPIDRTEALLPPGRPARLMLKNDSRVSLEELLKQDESGSLEIKGSAFTPIALGEASKLSETRESLASRSKAVRDAITKTCAGFLNSHGGVLLIGLLEADRAKLTDAQRYNPDAREVENYIAVGVDTSVDGKRVTWDEFERRLRSQLSSSIAPSPDPWIEIHSLSIDSLKLAAVIVSEPNTWFWANTSAEQDVFYVRYGNATRPLRGPAQLQHIRSVRRD